MPTTPGRIIAVTSQKGGVGKSATAVNLAGALVRRTSGRVLLVDLDAQGTAATTLGVHTDTLTTTIGALIVDGETSPHTLSDAIAYNAGMPRLDVAAGGGADLETAALKITQAAGGEFYLRTLLTPARDVYDYIVIDTKPALDRLVLAAIIAADGVIVVHVARLEAVKSTANTVGFIRKAQHHGMTNATLLGLVTNQDTPKQLISQWSEELLADLDLPRFTAAIPQRTKVAQAAAFKAPIVQMWPDDGLAHAYDELAAETITRLHASAE